MIVLEYGLKGQPIIDLGKYGRLIFSSLTVTNKGYKYFAYVNRFIEELVVKNNTTGERSIKTENGFDSYMFDMHFKRNGGKQGVPSGTIPRKVVSKLSKIIGQFLVEDTYMPKNCIKLLAPAINSVDWEKMLRKPKKRKRKLKIKEK